MAKRGHPRRDGLKRRVGTREPKRTFLVLCEGKKTEPGYLAALRELPEVKDAAEVGVRVDTSHAGDAPLTLVEAAINLKARSDEIDELWCLFDVEAPDPHPNLAQARALAQKNNVRVAISNPCFEVWLVMHFKPHTRWLSTAEAVRLRRECDGSTGKEVDGTLYMADRWAAAAHARNLRDKHVDEATLFPDDNPSSGMFELLDAIEQRSGN